MHTYIHTHKYRQIDDVNNVHDGIEKYCGMKMLKKEK